MDTKRQVTSDGRIGVAVVCGPHLSHLATCATLIRAGVLVKGICICNQESAGLPLRYVWTAMRKKGVSKVVGQILGRLFYRLLNQRQDREIFRRLYHENEIRRAIDLWEGPIHRTRSYDDKETLSWLESLGAEAFVVHSPYWVGKNVRRIPRKGVVLGGHPGLTPRYRGSHSAFWAVFEGHPEDVGCSIFWLDGGADTGDLIAQERIRPAPGDSYVTLAWKGMIRQAELFAEVLQNYEQGQEIPRRPHAHVPDGSYYDVPTLAEYLAYRRRQREVR